MRHATFHISFVVVGILLGVGSFSSLSAQETIAWEKDINTALIKAKTENRLVFVHFYGANCPPCKLMEAEVFPNKQVVADMNRFYVPVKVDTALNPQLVKQFDVKAIPADVILQPDGQFVHRRQGGISAERFDVYLNFMYEEARSKNKVGAPATTPPGALSESGNVFVPATPPPAAPPEPRQAPPSPTATNPPPNPWNQTVAPPPVDVKSFAAPAPPQPPVPTATSTPSERNNPVRAELPETAAKGVSLAETPVPLEGTNGNTVEIPLALEGFCPVTLSTQERWQPGNPLFYAMYHGQIFRCVNEETLGTFTREPAKYAPVAMGEDIVQMVNRNKKVAGLRKFGAWFQDRVYLFSSQESLDAFAAKPEFYAEIALKYETALRTRFDAVQR